ncbi:MAG: FecR domain-containing protein [Saprospiraceae bacterium]|nr:FecR domain-containing protein [Saprospiraceae bacterium]
MHYQNYKIEDFLLDESFIAWAKFNENDAFWQAFLAANPKQKAVVEYAKNMIWAAHTPIDTHQKQRLKAQIFEQIELEETIEARKPKIRRLIYGALAAAASVALLASAWFFYDKNVRHTEGGQLVYQELVRKAETPLLEVYNEKDKPQLIILSDKSSVLLQKGSRLSYPKGFDSVSKRVVYLSGEAFFEVEKNPEKPFIVYANEVITKVLGTSFNVKAYSNDKDIIVTVKTGKVTVASNKEIQEKEAFSSRNTEGVVVTPNQQIVFNRSDAQILKSLVQTPALQKLPDIQKLSFEFDDTPISKVFDLLEKAYSIDIVYDEELLKHCKLTAKMTDEHLFEKLRLICLTIDAEYQVIDAQIVIHSKGCK